MDKIVHLFSTPLQHTDISVSPKVFEFIKSQEFVFHGDGYMTHEHILECPEMEYIKNIITNEVKSYLYDICYISETIIPELVTSWVNLHKRGNLAKIHRHTNSIVSGIWYLSTTKNSGKLLLHTNNKLFGDLLDFPKKENSFNSDYCTFQPKTGNLILFPSNLNHSVSPNQSDEYRYSLAFNYMLRGDVKVGDTTIKL